MNTIIVMKVFSTIAIVALFIFLIYKTSQTVKPTAKAFLYMILEIVLAVGMVFGSYFLINQGFIKVKLTKLKNRPIPSSEKLSVSGCVRNYGTYKASTVTLHIKVINNASGGSFSDSGDGRDSTLELDTVVARNLAPKTQKCFNKRFKYPPYFRLANIRTHIRAN